MVNSGDAVSGDPFLDYCVTGNTISRTALDQVLMTIESDSRVSHLFIAKRERLFRPDEPFDAVKWEENLREMGVTIVYQDKILSPLKRGQRKDLADRITSLLEFDKSGRFRAELASKMIHSHAQLAALARIIHGNEVFWCNTIEINGLP